MAMGEWKFIWNYLIAAIYKFISYFLKLGTSLTQKFLSKILQLSLDKYGKQKYLRAWVFRSSLWRSPSPEPIYNNEGKRLNTREYRTRKNLEEERHQLVQQAISLNCDYKPPADYKYGTYKKHFCFQV